MLTLPWFIMTWSQIQNFIKKRKRKERGNISGTKAVVYLVLVICVDIMNTGILLRSCCSPSLNHFMIKLIPFGLGFSDTMLHLAAIWHPFFSSFFLLVSLEFVLFFLEMRISCALQREHLVLVAVPLNGLRCFSNISYHSIHIWSESLVIF